MRRVPVTSSNIAEIGYDQESSTLEVLFRSGGLYQYFNVPSQEHQALMAASSHGGYLNEFIKGRYRYARI
jgi:KTSC domain